MIRARAGEIERGLEAHDLFLDERRRRRRNAPLRDRLRRAPGGETLLQTLERATDPTEGRRTLEGRPAEGGTARFAASDDDALGAERTLTDRNNARRRAFGVLEDGDRTLAAVELLAANGAGRPNPRLLSREDEERLFAAELAVQDAASHHGAPSVLREVQAMLAEQDAAEQERLIQETAAKIPGGTESVADFRREQRLKEERIRNAPPTRALSTDEQERLFAAGLEQDEQASRGGVSEFQRQQLEAQLIDAGLEDDERAARGGVSEFQRLKLQEQLVDAGLETEATAAAPETNRFDLLGQVREMFHATTTAPFETAPETWRAFAGDGVNGRTPEMRFREIGDSLGYSSDQIDALLAGASVEEVGRPRATVAGVRGALTILQVREPRQFEPSGAVIRAIDATPFGNLFRTASGVGGALLDGDPLEAADELGTGLIERARDLNPVLLATDTLFRRGRDRPDSAFEAAVGIPLDLLEDAGRPGGAAVNALSSSSDDEPIDLDPGAIWDRIREGFADPRSTSGRRIFGMSRLSDDDVIGSISPRDVGGFVTELVVDPLNLVPGLGVSDEALDAVRRGLRSLGRRGTRAVDSPPPPRFDPELGSEANEALLRLVAEDSPREGLQSLALVQDLIRGDDSTGGLFSGSASRALRPDARGQFEAGSLAAARSDDALVTLATIDPRGFVSKPDLVDRLGDALTRSTDRVARAQAAVNQALGNSTIDSRAVIARLSRIPPDTPPAELQRVGIAIVRDNIVTPAAPSGFVDFGELAAREAERDALARRMFEFLIAVATHDWVVRRLEDGIEKGGIDSVERLLVELDAS